MDIREICNELNNRSKSYQVGKLQRLRSKIKDISRPKTLNIFSDQTIDEDWAFHSGGRTELQFNIGTEKEGFRYGLALSLQLSRTLPDISDFEVKILRFNEYLLANTHDLDNIKMWVHSPSGRSEIKKISEIKLTHFQEGNFIFFGLLCDADSIDYEHVLQTFDQLLPIYEYVESNTSLNESILSKSASFTFSGFSEDKKLYGTYSSPAKKFEVKFKHNELQLKLCQLLSNKYGVVNVGDECLTKFGTRVDAVVKNTEGFIFYEIKTNSTLKLCIREALGQLLEYGYWDSDVVPQKLVVVGDHSVNEVAIKYLRKLRDEFNLPIYYQRVGINDISLSTMY
ncbi:hypothetical protein [Pseudoalteromonas sp. SWYJZ12]|uniref:hypothetical protein n=1 Tax=Pseudoalteromonas sp. SWYJZ12 TaxID=2792067 RepID=UPI0018CFAB40|nr:hypothetical protein [Pseudoalteromonas sp. SWYJZ12]MBH0002409.1 hypothetical protein [Pseudoalteromonas sp. SWYJZ12]